MALSGKATVLVLATLPPASLRERLETVRNRYPDRKLLVLSAGNGSYGVDIDVAVIPGPYIGFFHSYRALLQLRRQKMERVIVPYAGTDSRGYLNAHLAAVLVRTRGSYGLSSSGEERAVTAVTILAGLGRSLTAQFQLLIFLVEVVLLVLKGRFSRRRPREAAGKSLILLSYYFPPQGGPAVQRPLSFARHLPRFGWRPIVLAGELTKTIGMDESLSTGLGSDLPVYRPGPGGDRWVARFRDLPRPLRHVPDQYLGWIIWVLKTILSPEVAHRNPWAIMATAPPYSSFIAAKAVSAATGLPLVLDYRDGWTMEGPEKSFTGFSRWVEEKLERWVLSGEGKITVVVRRFKRYLKELKPDLESRRLFWLPNGYEPDDFRDLTPIRPAGGRTTLYYMGSFFGKRSPETLFGAFADLLNRRPDLRETVALSFAGRESQGVKGWAVEHGVESNVVTLGYLNHRTALAHLMGADGLILLVNEDLPGLVSGKLYEYMASGKPVFGLVPPDGEAAGLIRRYGRGMVVSASAVEGKAGVAEALEEFIDSLPELGSRRGSSYYRAFQRDIITGRLARLLDSL
jgi:glycosyltransferase involved in cell wall biosynthesis